jgi:hypothetical protein
MLDRLADIQHEIWAHWMGYLFDVSKSNEDGSVTIPADKATKWKRQMNTRYSDLPAEEQKSDLDQANKVISAIRNNTQ